MNKRLLTKWVEALRSGRYKQGRGFLSRDNADCCLGVLCKVAIDEGYPISQVSQSDSSLIEFDGSTRYIPHNTYKKIDLISVYKIESDLALMNDRDVPFDQIADYIEKNIPNE